MLSVDSQKSEDNLRQVIDTLPTLVWCTRPDGSTEFLNKRWHDYTGCSPEESRVHGWQPTVHPEDLPRVVAKGQELLASGQPGEVEGRIRRHDGVFRWFLMRVEPLRDETGKSSDGTELRPTSTPLSRLKRSCEKRIANCAGSPTPFRRQLSSRSERRSCLCKPGDARLYGTLGRRCSHV
jgi:PAS domain S-box-containing protein